MALSAHLVFVQGLFEQLQQHPHGLSYYVLFLAGWTLCCLPTTPVEIAAGFTWSVGLSSTGERAPSKLITPHRPHTSSCEAVAS